MGMKTRVAIIGAGSLAIGCLVSVSGCTSTSARSSGAEQDLVSGSVAIEVAPGDADRVFEAALDTLMSASHRA